MNSILESNQESQDSQAKIELIGVLSFWMRGAQSCGNNDNYKKQGQSVKKENTFTPENLIVTKLSWTKMLKSIP